jgi:hypothetical protein
VVTAEELAARAEIVKGAPDLRALLEHLRARARPIIERMPTVPEHKALISIDGGSCPDDATVLTFDPWSPAEHRCPRCGKTWRGDRHERYWARFQHLWLAERAAHLAALAAIGGKHDEAAAARARDILHAYAERYWRYPNRDNVLGPSRLFFSTYLESLWICNYLAAAMLLRAGGLLDDATRRGVNQVADEAATLIGDYDENFSNRQTWNNAALAAVAVWFEDEELAQRAIEGDTGLIAHLVRGFGRDGMWYEGENYHLFALRGLLTGAGWARLAGVDLSADDRLAPRLHAALQAPALTALPDYTYPARKDARFGISLAQPAHLELWEIGLAQLVRRAPCAVRGKYLSAWLSALYHEPPPQPDTLESYLHDAGAPRTAHSARRSLSWWSLLEILPELPVPDAPWEPGSALFESQGLAVLRSGSRYVSLECGPHAGGHGHPDRLHLTLHADGVHWLPDPGTGQYVTRDLYWYRSTLAHNAPRVDSESQPPGDATCECFDDQGEWAWVRGRFDNLNRIVTTGPAYIVDVTDMTAPEEHLLELPWHIAGRGTVETKGRWVDDELADEFVSRVHRFVPEEHGGEGRGAIVLAHVQDRRQLRLHLVFEGELLEIEGPGLPGPHDRATFYVVRARRRNVRIVAVLEVHSGTSVVRTVQPRGDAVEIETTAGVDRHRFTGSSWTVEQEAQAPRTLSGAREPRPAFVPLLRIDPPIQIAGTAFRVGGAPPLDGTLNGFELAEPLQLALEDQYRRSEDGYPGPDDFSASAYAAWDERALYLAVDITKPDVCLRPGSAPPLKFDNEPDDIHSDGLQVYLGGSGTVGYLIVPNQSGHDVRAHPTSDTRSHAQVAASLTGGWQRTETGYCVTVAIPWPEGLHPHAGGRVAFDLIINELLPGRIRRVGQLVWSGGGGWVWLRADRQDPARFGILELVE